jgi:hypothetical protein
MAEEEYKEYFGTKRVRAAPQEDGDGVRGYTVVYDDSYVSWSPSTAFEKAYRESGRMNFGHALAALKDGRKVARSVWRPKGMCLILPLDDNIAPIQIMTMRGVSTTVWYSSRFDLVADDWEIVVDEVS